MLLPVLINAPTFEIYKSKQKDKGITNPRNLSDDNNNKTSTKDEDLSTFKQTILQNLVRRLYQVSLKEGIVLSEKEIRKKGLSQLNENSIKYFFKVIKRVLKKNEMEVV